MPRTHRLLSTVVAASLSIAVAARARAAPEEAEPILATVEGKPAALEAVKRARQAVARALAMSRAGDAQHSALLRRVALEWALVARDVVRAAAVEAQATQTERTFDELETKALRTRALLEETIARRGRASEALRQAEAAAAAAPPATPAPPPPAPKKKP